MPVRACVCTCARSKRLGAVRGAITKPDIQVTQARRGPGHCVSDRGEKSKPDLTWLLVRDCRRGADGAFAGQVTGASGQVLFSAGGTIEHSYGSASETPFEKLWCTPFGYKWSNHRRYGAPSLSFPVPPLQNC